MSIQYRTTHARRIVRAGDAQQPAELGKIYTSVRDAWKALQARKPGIYGSDTRNPRWRLRPQ